MTGCEMDNGESFALDDISDGFFPQETGADGSDFNWADDFLSSAEGQEPISSSSSSATQHQTIGISHANIAQQITQNAQVASGQYVISNPVAQLQVTNTGQGIQFVQPIQNVATAGSIPNLIGSGAQLVRGPNGQLMLKTINTSNLQVQQAPQAIVQSIAPAPQGHQTLFQQNQTSVLQANQGQNHLQQLHSTVLNRSVTPNHPSPSASPVVSRSQTPASSPHISNRSLTPSQTSTVSQGQGQQQVLGNIAGQTNLNVFQIPGNTQSPLITRGIQLQGINQASNVSAGGVNLQGQTLQGFVQTSQGQTYVQGQGQTAVLQGQGQNIVNTQNTVIQNPNVVNLNVAHVLCNPNLQNQTGQSVQQLAPGVQGTLIQLADGKNIIIPSQNLQAGQSVNLQQLLQPQLNVAQTSTANNSGLLQGATVLGGNVVGGLGNLIRLAPSQAAGQDKTNNTATAATPATHFIGVNQQGQQVLIQRTPTPNTHQNIVVRAIAPQNVLQIQQPAGSGGNVATSSQYQQNIITLQNPLQVQQAPASGNSIQVQQTSATGNPLQVQQPTASGNPMQVQPIASVNVATATSQSQFQTATGNQLTQQQQLVMASQQQGIRIVTGPQGQQFKIVGQPGAIPMTLNLQNLQGNQAQAIQLLQQPQQQQMQATSQSEDAQRVPSVSQTVPMSSFATASVGSTMQRQSGQQQQQSSDGSFQLSNTSQVFGQTVIQTKTLPSSVQPLQPALSTQSSYLMKTQKMTSSTISLSTACSTVVTSTLTSSQASSISSLVVNGQTQVISSPLAVSGQNTLQARKSAPRLQTSTVQLPPELKKKLNMVQAEIVKIASIRGPLSQEMREKSRALLDLRKKILAQGQTVSSTSEQTLPIHTVQQLLTSKRLEEGSHEVTQNQLSATQSQQQGTFGQGQQVINQTLITVPQSQPPGSQLGSQVVGQQVQGQIQIQQFQGQVVSQSNAVSSIPVQGTLRVSVAPASVSLSNTVQVSPSMTFGGTMTTVQQSGATNLSALGNLVTNSQGNTATSSQGSTGSSQIAGSTPGTMVHPTSTAGGNIPNVVTQTAVPTQIKIGNHILNLNLTPAQKEKVEGYLSKMSPEQQQQQISMFLKLQQQQQLQAQVQAQVKAQQNKILIQQQQGKTVVQTSSASIPLTVQAGQKVVDAGQTVIINTPGKPQMMIKRVSVAAIPKSQLILQQLHKDQENALKPDTKTPYRSRRDTYRRLLRYHVYQSKHPPQNVIEKDEEMFENMASGIMRKSDFLFEKFRILMMKESMREKQTAEMVMIQRLLNEDLKDTLQCEKKMAAENPDSFEPLPIEVLLRKTSDSVKEEIKTEPESAIKQEITDDNEMARINSPSCHGIKTEESSSRPSTPKVKLVIRSDGQSFSSSIRESLCSDTEESSQEEKVDLGDDIDIEMTDCRSPLLNSIKNEPIEVDESADQTADWSDISVEEKPFSQYMETDIDDQSSQDTVLVQNDRYMDISSDAQLHDQVKGESMSEELQSSYGAVNEESDEAVQNLLSTDGLQGYHTVGSFHSHNADKTFHRHLPFSTSCHQQTLNRSEETSNTDKVKIPHNESDSVNKGISFSQDSIHVSLSASDSMQTISQSSTAQYEPISSPEGDNEDDFFTHKLDMSYSVGGHKLDFCPTSSLSSQSLSQASKETTSAVIEVANDDGTTSDSSDDSTDEDDDDDDIEGLTATQEDHHLNSQMQSAIDSILSLNNDSSENLQTHYSSQSQHFMQPEYESSQSGNSAINSPQTEENDNFSMDDDLDAAVKSILM